MLGIPIIEFDEEVEFIDSSCPDARHVHFGGRHGDEPVLHPITRYVGRPAVLADITFCKFWTDYLIVGKNESRKTFEHIGVDSEGRKVYKRPKPIIVR